MRSKAKRVRPVRGVRPAVVPHVRSMDGSRRQRLRGKKPSSQAQWMWSPLPDAHVRLVLASDATLVRANMCRSLRCVLPGRAKVAETGRTFLALNQNLPYPSGF